MKHAVYNLKYLVFSYKLKNDSMKKGLNSNYFKG